MKKTALLAAVAAAMIAAPMASAQVPPLADDVKPMRMSGVGLKVNDIERSMKFYTEVIGMKVASKVPGKDGKVAEYLLGMTGVTTADNLIVISQGKVTPEMTTFGRVVFVVPSGKKMAERVIANGGSSAAAPKEGTNIVKDPDGYVIELYQRAAAPAAAPAAKPAEHQNH